MRGKLQTKNNYEKTLDPNDWSELKKIGHRMIDDMLNHLEYIQEMPVWRKPPDSVKEFLQESLPENSQDVETIYDDFLKHILPYSMGNIHPRFWGWVVGTGTPVGMLAEMLTAAMNSNSSGGDHAATYIENQILNWCRQLIGYHNQASGILVSGGSIANLYAMIVARNSQLGWDIRKKGLKDNPNKFIIYCSKETHFSIIKAVETIGLGSDSIHFIPVNENFEIDYRELEIQLEKDKSNGFTPLCLIGNFGTVNTGAIDDIKLLAEFCERENIWFHIDGAFGVLALSLPEFKKYLPAINKADSVAFDLHKWMHVPYDAACILFKDPELHKRSFEYIPDYFLPHEKGLLTGPSFSNLGIELSRGNKALKTWFVIKEQGAKKFRTLFRQNVYQAQYLKNRINEKDQLEILAPVNLNIVCFRFIEKLSDNQLNWLNKQILMELQESGVALPSSTVLNGKYALRVSITNHRSKREDFDLLIKKVISLGNDIKLNIPKL